MAAHAHGAPCAMCTQQPGSRQQEGQISAQVLPVHAKQPHIILQSTAFHSFPLDPPNPGLPHCIASCCAASPCSGRPALRACFAHCRACTCLPSHACWPPLTCTRLTILQQVEIQSVQLLERERGGAAASGSGGCAAGTGSKQQRAAEGNSEAQSRERGRQLRRAAGAGRRSTRISHLSNSRRVGCHARGRNRQAVALLRRACRAAKRCLSWPCKTAPGRGSTSAAWPPCPVQWGWRGGAAGRRRLVAGQRRHGNY